MATPAGRSDDDASRHSLTPHALPDTIAWFARRVTACAVTLTACAPWPRGPQLSPAASGLVGEWLAPGKPRPPDTTVLQFAPSGSARETVRQGGHETQEVPLGQFRVWADTGRVRMVCYAARRSRSEPGCRYFAVDSVIDAAGRHWRRLRFFNWVTARAETTPETWIAVTR